MSEDKRGEGKTNSAFTGIISGTEVEGKVGGEVEGEVEGLLKASWVEGGHSVEKTGERKRGKGRHFFLAAEKLFLSGATALSSLVRTENIVFILDDFLARTVTYCEGAQEGHDTDKLPRPP